MRANTVLAVLMMLVAGAPLSMGVELPMEGSLAVAPPGPELSAEGPTMAVSTPPLEAKGPAGANVPFLVDESGDTMSGDLAFPESLGVQFPGGKLHGDTGLTFGANAVCLADVLVPGCGDITAILPAPDSGLTGGGEAGDVVLGTDPAVLQRRVGGVCAPGHSIRTIDEGGAVSCEQDDDTTYTAGAGLSLLGTVFSIPVGGVTSLLIADGSLTAADTDSSSIQRRVSGACAPGQALRSIASDGSVACEVDDDTTYGAGDGLVLEGTTFRASDSLQRRVASTCPAGSAIRTINASGAVTCETDDDTNSGGTVTNVTAGAGLTGGPITTTGTLRIAPGGVVGSMVANGTVEGSHLADGAVSSAKLADGAVTTADIADGTVQLVDMGFVVGDITGVSPGAGLLGGGTTGNLVLSADPAYLQRRVASSCGAGSSISAIAADGTVTCETDDGGVVFASAPITVVDGNLLGLMACADSLENILKYNATSAAWRCSLDRDSGGDLTAVAAGVGLSGGGDTGAVTLALAPPTSTTLGGVTSASCSGTQKANGITTAGLLTCASDQDTLYTAGEGLVLAGATLKVRDCAANELLKRNAGDTDWTCGVDQGQSYTAGDGLALTGSAFTLADCAANQVLKRTAADTAWACAADADSGGDITAVTTSGGLTGGGTTGALALGVDSTVIQSRITGTCSGNTAILSVSSLGAVSCGGGDVTAVAAGAGLIGGGTTGALTVGLNTATITACSDADEKILWDSANTRLTCGVDASGTDWARTGNAGTSPGSDFLGTTDAQALEFRVNNARALRLEPGATPNLVGGHNSNEVGAGLVGATIAGGGRAGGANRVGDDWATVGGGANNHAGNASVPYGDNATVAGGGDNRAIARGSTVGGGIGNTAGTTDTGWHTYPGVGATVAGGGFNHAHAYASFIGAGTHNHAKGESSVVVGGWNNTADEYTAAVVSGWGNHALGVGSFVGSGMHVNATGAYSSAVGGSDNLATALYSSVLGGRQNLASGPYSGVGGGKLNLARGNYAWAGGGEKVVAWGDWASAAGGWSVNASGDYSTVAGGWKINATAAGAFVGGGFDNQASGLFSTLGGGRENLATGAESSVLGGVRNRATGQYAMVGGGFSNKAARWATVGGGHTNEASDFATVAGGDENRATGWWAAIAGGDRNTAGMDYSAVGGGSVNQALAEAAFVGGGFGNGAGGAYSTVAGGYANLASGYSSTIPGGSGNNALGNYSFAAGRHATAAHNGTFVWADDLPTGTSGTEFVSTAPRQFLVRASGGVGFNVTDPQGDFHVAGDADGVQLVVSASTTTINNDATVVFAEGSAATLGASILYNGTSNDRLQFGGLNNGVVRGPWFNMTRDTGRFGLGRLSSANRLEIEGDASKTTAGDWLANSDARIKTGVRGLEGALAVVEDLRPVAFRYTPEYRAAHPGIEDKEYYNFIAQEFEQVFPTYVKDSGEGGFLQMDAYPAQVHAIAAIQELSHMVRERDARIDHLLDRLERIEARLGLDAPVMPPAKPYRAPVVPSLAEKSLTPLSWSAEVELVDGAALVEFPRSFAAALSSAAPVTVTLTPSTGTGPVVLESYDRSHATVLGVEGSNGSFTLHVQGMTRGVSAP